MERNLFIAKVQAVSANNAEYIYIFHVHHGLLGHINQLCGQFVYIYSLCCNSSSFYCPRMLVYCGCRHTVLHMELSMYIQRSIMSTVCLYIQSLLQLIVIVLFTYASLWLTSVWCYTTYFQWKTICYYIVVQGHSLSITNNDIATT